MGKAEIGSAKYISNKLKAKGLSKLKFYCQVCEKQCRDENGFKCHIISKSHNEKISQLSRGTIDDYSERFVQSFMKLLRLNHGNKFVDANKFYQEYIMDREHVHLNSTKWKSLTLFCIYGQDQGKLQIKLQEGDEDVEQMEHLQIRYIDKYKESLVSQGSNKTETDTSLKYMEQQVQLNRLKFEKDSSDPVRTLGDHNTNNSGPISILIKDKVYDKPINKCGVMCKPVKPGNLEKIEVGLFKLKNPKLKPRKGNVFKMS